MAGGEGTLGAGLGVQGNLRAELDLLKLGTAALMVGAECCASGLFSGQVGLSPRR